MEPIVASIGPFAMLGCEPRQVRKEATVTTDACAEVWLVLATMGFLHFVMAKPHTTEDGAINCDSSRLVQAKTLLSRSI